MSDWTEWKWTPEKPYPETLETLVHVAFKDGEIDTEHDMNPETVAFWIGGYPFISSWVPLSRYSISHYKVIK